MQNDFKHGWITVFFSLLLLVFLVWSLFHEQPQNSRVSAILLLIGALLAFYPAYLGIIKQYLPIPKSNLSFRGKTAIFTGIIYLLAAIGCLYLAARILAGA